MEINTSNLPQRETNPQLFNPDDFYEYPKIEYRDEKMLDNSDAWSVVGYTHCEGAEEILAEVFLEDNYLGARDVPVVVVWDRISTEISSTPEFRSSDHDEILWYSKQALCQYTLERAPSSLVSCSQ